MIFPSEVEKWHGPLGVVKELFLEGHTFGDALLTVAAAQVSLSLSSNLFSDLELQISLIAPCMHSILSPELRTLLSRAVSKYLALRKNVHFIAIRICSLWYLVVSGFRIS